MEVHFKCVLDARHAVGGREDDGFEMTERIFERAGHRVEAGQ